MAQKFCFVQKLQVPDLFALLRFQHTQTSLAKTVCFETAAKDSHALVLKTQETNEAQKANEVENRHPK